jgi:hypothetical protein
VDADLKRKLWGISGTGVQELVGLAVLLILGVVPRLIMVNAFPTKPVSDFLGVHHLALSFKNDLLARGDPYWLWRSPGLPLILGTLYRIIPAEPEAVGRWATAIIGGLLALLPFLLWKGEFSLRARMLAGLLLALWPGQIVFSGTLADDTWVLPPTVALAALATTCMVDRRAAYPVWGGVLFALAILIRQESPVLLLPLAIPTILGGQRQRWLRNALVGSIAPLLVIVGLIAMRGAATGRYTLFTGHFGNAFVGSYVPGSGLFWTDPRPYVRALHPEIVSEEQLNHEAWRLVWDEVYRRPGFQAIRRMGSVFESFFRSDLDVANWSLLGVDVLPEQLSARAAGLMADLTPLLKFYPRIILGLFITAIVYTWQKRHLFARLVPITVVVGLTAALHFLVGESPSFFLVVTAIQILGIAAVADGMTLRSEWRSAAIALAGGIVAVTVLVFLIRQVRDYVQMHDEVPQLDYSFPLGVRHAWVRCSMHDGILIAGDQNMAVFQLLNSDPEPGDLARIDCEVQSRALQSYQLLLLDSYAGGPFPGRIEQVVYVEGREVLRHDLAAEPWTGRMTVALGTVEAGSILRFAVELVAVAPDPGWDWGESSRSEFRLETIQ